jgi:hypothetical protein
MQVALAPDWQLRRPIKPASLEDLNSMEFYENTPSTLLS